MSGHSLVSIVDDDESIRESLPDLLGQLGYATRTFSSAAAFLGSAAIDDTVVLILDVAMPGMSGPELQRELIGRGRTMPVVFITAHQDETLRPRLLEQGAVECLFKPFTADALIVALRAALPVA